MEKYSVQCVLNILWCRSVVCTRMILVELLEEFQLRQVKRFREAVSLSKAPYIKINTPYKMNQV